MGDFQAKLAEFIRRLGVDDDRLEMLERRATALDQGIRNLWTDGLGGSNACLSTLNGKIIGSPFTTAGLAESTLQITGHTTGKDYGTYVVTSGTFSLVLVISAADTTLDFVVTGPGARFQPGPPINRSIAVCGTTNLANLGATPAPGHQWLTGVCQFPVREGMSFTNATLGTNDLIWNGTYWTFCQDITSLNAGVCTSVGTTVWTEFFLTMSFLSRYPATLTGPSGSCPIAWSCPTFPSPAAIATQGSPGSFFSITCPDVTTDFSVTWKYTFNSPGSPILGIAAGVPITFYETPI